MSGALFALLLGRIAPESFSLNQLLLGFAMVMVGGMGTVAGPVLGAILLTVAPEFLRNIAGAEEILYSFLLIGLLLFMPSGLFGGLCTLLPSLRERHLGAAR
jgi:branched-chain amino acid transport system permease protein